MRLYVQFRRQWSYFKVSLKSWERRKKNLVEIIFDNYLFIKYLFALDVNCRKELKLKKKNYFKLPNKAACWINRLVIFLHFLETNVFFTILSIFHIINNKSFLHIHVFWSACLLGSSEQLQNYISVLWCIQSSPLNFQKLLWCPGVVLWTFQQNHGASFSSGKENNTKISHEL